MKLLVFSDFDSRLKWGLALANYLRSIFESVIVYHRENTLEQVKAYVRQEYTMKRYGSMSEMLEKEDIFLKAEVIILAIGGTKNIYFLNALGRFFRKYQQRPIVIAGMNGLTDCSDLHAVLCRIGADIICINSKRNFRIFKEKLQDLNVKNDNLLMLGYARLYGDNTEKSRNCNNGKQITLLIGQANMPAQKKQQSYLMKKVYEYALKYPDHLVVIKERSITHKEHMNAYFKKKEIFQLWRWRYKIKRKPDNILISNEPIESLLGKADVCLGFYSTALIEAIHLGIPTIVIQDFGIGKNIGNHDFLGSGVLHSLNDWIDNKLPIVNKGWKDENCNFASEVEIDLLKKAVIKKIKEKREEVVQYYSEEKFPYFYDK
ncbi:conserved hypothetical protein [Helicobacter canadensis MIT 98-5491]|uniref:Polysaccharide pyruvyl transferase domain-containing protein n=2 Tax=Helicobacter canadensis TaxID=123841 RepID=C5ZW69_9HELI|nr:conserved hypothetical protein [Helicobacter canadensis MIT 98-5491]